MRAIKIGAVLGIVMLAVSSARAVLPAPVFVGAQVTGVWFNSPAQRAGLEVGDVIVAVNGQPVRSMQEYLVRVGSAPQANLLVRDVRSGGYTNRYVMPVNGKLGITFLMVPVPAATPVTVVQPVVQPVILPVINAQP